MKKNYKNARRIRAMLLMKGIKITEIAKITGNSPKTVGTIINYYPIKKSRRIQEAIANALSRPFEKIWRHERNHNLTITKKRRVVNDN
jgi:lambda repressor-like predicted transcriptional regulator